MLTVNFEWSPHVSPVEPDYRIIGDAMEEAAGAFKGALKGALQGSVFPGMTGPVTLDEPTVSYQTLGQFEFTVTGPDLGNIEEGIKPWDMKPGLLNGPRHRIAKDGSRYNIIPFTHNRDSMPSHIQAMADQLETSAIIGHYMDSLGVTRNVYRWGEGRQGLWQIPATSNLSLLSLNVSSTGYVRKTTRYSGMVKMRGVGYMTFRTVSDKSPAESWWNPGQQGNPVSESVWNFMIPLVEAHIGEAWGKVFDAWLFSPNAR